MEYKNESSFPMYNKMKNEIKTDYEAAWNDLYYFVTEGNSIISDASRAVLLVVENRMKQLKDQYTKED